jgi:ATP-binding cassette subfamily B protein
MIPRLYDPDHGSVLVGGLDVRDYSLEHIRDAVSIVLQKNVLFSGTIADNLRWGNAEAKKEDIELACRIACADEFIGKLSDGYDSEVQHGGANFSGGQRQRLCIARALVKKPKILILDDSTSAVDMATDAKIRRSLKNYMSDVTKIVIAQRIDSVMESDMIIVMDEGTVVGTGTHEELLRNCDIYKEIYYSQKDEEAVGLKRGV